VQVDGKPDIPAGQPPRGPGLFGSVDQICEELIKQREEFDVSYIMVIGPVIDIFAPVVARLAGK
jgi:hypothetical protein